MGVSAWLCVVCVWFVDAGCLVVLLLLWLLVWLVRLVDGCVACGCVASCWLACYHVVCCCQGVGLFVGSIDGWCVVCGKCVVAVARGDATLLADGVAAACDWGRWATLRGRAATISGCRTAHCGTPEGARVGGRVGGLVVAAVARTATHTPMHGIRQVPTA